MVQVLDHPGESRSEVFDRWLTVTGRPDVGAHHSGVLELGNNHVLTVLDRNQLLAFLLCGVLTDLRCEVDECGKGQDRAEELAHGPQFGDGHVPMLLLRQAVSAIRCQASPRRDP